MEVGRSLHKETGECVYVCVRHVACCMVLYLYLPSRYLNVAFHRHYDYREREREREEMREFDSVMMTVSPFHFSLFLSFSLSLSHLYHLASN